MAIDKGKRKGELKSHLLKLNESFLQWAKTQPVGSILSSGAKDYIKYAKDLEEEFRDVVQSNDSATTTTNTTSAFGVAVENGSASSGKFSSPFNFSSSPPSLSSAPVFNFGGAGAATSLTPTHSQIAGAEERTTEEEAKSKKATSSPKVAAAAAAGESEDEKPLFESKSKVFKLAQSNGAAEWRDMGVGSLSLVKPDGSGAAFICFRSTTTGKILMRAGLYKGLKVKSSKKSTTLVLFPAKPDKPPPSKHNPGAPEPKKDSDDGKAHTFTFRFGKVETEQKFAKTIEDNCPQ